MVEKKFKILCSHDAYLTSETVAMALLKQVSMENKESKVFFAVKEVKKDKINRNDSKQICFTE